MKYKNLFRLLLDITLYVLYIVLVFGFGTSRFFHEVCGIGIVALFILHFTMNTRMFGSLHRRVSGENATVVQRLLYISDILLTGLVPISVMTGILISTELFYINTGAFIGSFYTFHKLVSYVSFGIMTLHFAFHAKYVIGVVKRIIASVKEKGMRRTFAGYAAGVLAVYFSYTIAYNAFSVPVYGDYENAEVNQPTEIIDQPDETYEEPTAETDDENEETITDDDKKEQTASENNAYTEPSVTETEIPSLNEFLGKLFCTGCHNRCSLLSPRCSTGRAQAVQAETKYYEEYGE